MLSLIPRKKADLLPPHASDTARVMSSGAVSAETPLPAIAGPADPVELCGVGPMGLGENPDPRRGGSTAIDVIRGAIVAVKLAVSVWVQGRAFPWSFLHVRGNVWAGRRDKAIVVSLASDKQGAMAAQQRAGELKS